MTRGAVACGHPVTAAAAMELLADGGNAFDAAVAAQFAACAAEPVLTSLAGGGFLLAHPSEGTPEVYDFFAQTPKRRRREVEFYPIEADFGTTRQEFHIGAGAVATPGTVAGMFAVHEALCSLPMTRIVEPAVRAARDGVAVNALQGAIFDIIRPIYVATDEARRIYGGVAEGSRLRQPELADTLEALARGGARFFYEGDGAAAVLAACRDGGHLRADDLAGYRVARRRPLTLDYRGARVLTNPPPSAGGLLVGLALALLDGREPGAFPFGGPEHLALLTEIMFQTNEARLDALAGGAETGALDPSLLHAYRAAVRDRPRFLRGTTHISVVDGAGNVAALTLSNGEGCGRMAPGTGIMLNNMLGEEDINPAGFGGWAPDTRMVSMMAPTLIERNGGAGNWRVALGSGGSNRIRTAILQVIVNLLDFGDPIALAVNRPRAHYERGKLSLEPGFADDAVATLEAQVEALEAWAAPSLFFGGVHVVEQAGARLGAAGDPRRGGVGRVAD